MAAPSSQFSSAAGPTGTEASYARPESIASRSAVPLSAEAQGTLPSSKATTPTQRLRPIRDADFTLRALREGSLASGGRRWTPSGVEEISFLLARAAVTNRATLAIAVPRGRHQLAPAVSAYLAFARANLLLPFVGNVALATSDPEARVRLERLRPAGSRFAGPLVRRLVAGPVRADGRPTTHIRPISGADGARGVSSDDRFLLVHRPSFQPSVSENVISVSIVDCVRCAEHTWPTLRAWSEEAGRGQVFLGELGDKAFEDFCNEHSVPVWRFDRPILEAEDVLGGGGMALDALVRRSHESPPSLRYRVCDDGEADAHLRELDERFAQMLRRAKGEAPPRPVLAARRLSWFLARIAVPLDTYAASALREYGALNPLRELGYVTGAYKAQFAGAWAEPWESDWAVVAGAVRRLHEYIARESPKYLDLHAMIEECRAHRINVTIRCSSRAEARALGPALIENGAVSTDDLTGERPPVEVAWFGRQTPPLPFGPSTNRRLTIVTEPPPPFRGGLYCSAEEGTIEALLYPTQVRWLSLNSRRTAERCAGGASNAEIVESAYRGDVVADSKVGELSLEMVASVGFGGRRPITDAPPPDDALTRMMSFFSQIARMNEGATPIDARPDSASSGHRDRAALNAVLVQTRERTAVALPVGVKVDRMVRTRLRPIAVEDLPPGAQVVLVDGNQRGTVLHDLMESWDERFGPARVFYDLYLQALDSAYRRAGGTDADLAEVVGVRPGTVRGWRTGANLAPQQDATLRAVLAKSGDAQAKANFSQIRHYLGTVRGMHRLIGRILNDAAAETLVSDNGPAQRELQELTGLDLTDFFASLQVFTVTGVIQIGPVPAARLGRFLPPDDPIVIGATA